jgi:amino acid transporter
VAITAFVLLEYFAMRHVVSYAFISASNGISPGKYGALTSIPASSGGLIYGALFADSVSRIIFAVAYVAAGAAALVVFAVACSRAVFAFAFDRLLPSFLADVNTSLANPVKALAVISVIVMGLAAANTFSTSFITLSSNIVLLYLIFYGISAAAAGIMPFRRRELFDASPKIIPGKIGPVPVITVISAITIAVVGVIFWDTATNELLSGGFSTTSVIELAVIVLFAPTAYLLSLWRLRTTEGIDLNLASRELPPE